VRQSHPWDRWLERFPKENHAAISPELQPGPKREETRASRLSPQSCRKTITRSTHRSPKHLRGAGKYKFDYLDKTKDLSASSPRQNRATSLFSCPWRLIRARLPIYRQGRTVLSRRHLTTHTTHITHHFRRPPVADTGIVAGPVALGPRGNRAGRDPVSFLQA
jgi:hypothetical protein